MGDVTIGDMKGSAVKTIWVCVLFSLLSIVAYSGFSDALSGAKQPLLITPAGAIAVDAPSSRSAPDSSTESDNNPAEGLSEYVFLHKTWNARIPASTPAGLSVPWHGLQTYAVTQRPTEDR